MPRITAELDMEARQFFSQFDRARKASSQAKGAMEREWSGFGGVASKGVGNIADELKGLLAVGGIAGMAAALKGSLDVFGDFADKAATLQETPETLQRVTQVAKEMGGSLEGVVAATVRLEKNLGDVENTKAAAVLEKYGLSVEKLMSMPLDQKIVVLAGAFQQAREDGSGVYEIQQLLGKGSTELIPLLSTAGDELRAMFDGVDVLANDAVARIDTLGDRLDRLGNNANVTAGRIIDAIAGLGAAAEDAIKDMVLGKDIGTSFAERLQKQDYDATAPDRDRQAAARALAANRAQEAETKAAEKSAKERQAAEEKAAKAKEDALKRIADLQKAINDGELSGLEGVDKVDALKKRLQEVYDTMQKSGGLFYAPSIQGLQEWAAGAMEQGSYGAAESALKLLEEAQSIMREIGSVTDGIQQDATRAAEEMAKSLESLRKDAERGGLDLLPPREKLLELKKQLQDVIGDVDLSKGLQEIREQIQQSRNQGDQLGEQAGLEKLQKAQSLAKEIGGVQVPERQFLLGSLGGAINRVLGRSSSEMVAEYSRQQNDTLNRIEKLMADLLRETKTGNRSNGVQSPVNLTFG
ncbi:MAG: hypothetical protein JNJ83_10945 [Verrucomicrobiaceae bacterium]|nr:hypothetical protein [Verrucomicrobiaceae bacterium]